MTGRNNNQTQTTEGRKRRWNDRGSALVMVTVAIIALFAFAALAIDGAILMTSRTQLQAAADAAALAGASGLIQGSQADATDRAINFASFNNAVQVTHSPVIITADDVTFPEPDMIRVRTHRTRATGDAIRTYFLRVLNPFNDNQADMTAVAAARFFDICSSQCLKPWAVPDKWDDVNANGLHDPGEYYHPDSTGYVAPRNVGDQIVLKVGNPQQSIASGQYYPVNYPPLDYPDENPLTGGEWYRTWIAECEPFLVGPGDRLQLEPGNMVGPTIQGVDALIAQDQNAYWDPTSNSIMGSDFGLSPRIGLVPFFDPTVPPESGRNWVTITKIGAFFIEETGPGSQVTGRFIQITMPGMACPPGGGNGGGFIQGISLVE